MTDELNLLKYAPGAISYYAAYGRSLYDEYICWFSKKWCWSNGSSAAPDNERRSIHTIHCSLRHTHQYDNVTWCRYLRFRDLIHMGCCLLKGADCGAAKGDAIHRQFEGSWDFGEGAPWQGEDVVALWQNLLLLLDKRIWSPSVSLVRRCLSVDYLLLFLM